MLNGKQGGDMGEYSAVYIKTEGLEETDLGLHHLLADALDAAVEEATERAPQGTNLIKICCAGQVIDWRMVGP
jgi:hypothetical protein